MSASCLCWRSWWAFKLDGTRSPEYQRRRVREAVEIYRRKGTIPAMRRDLAALGWQGELEETFRSALRLNARSRRGRSKLPGLVFSLGVFRVLCQEPDGRAAPGLGLSSPGRHALFLAADAGSNSWKAAQISVRPTRFGSPDSVGLYGRGLCPGPFIPGFLPSPDQQAARPRVHAADQHGRNVAGNRPGRVKVARFHGRQDRMRLNQRMLNDRRLSEHQRRGRTAFRSARPSTPAGIISRRVLQSRFGLGDERISIVML